MGRVAAASSGRSMVVDFGCAVILLRSLLAHRRHEPVPPTPVSPKTISKNSLAKRRHPPYTNRRKLPLTQNTSGEIGIKCLLHKLLFLGSRPSAVPPGAHPGV